MSCTLAILAQATQPAPGGGGLPGLISNPLFLLILMLGAFYLVVFRGQSKEKKKKQQMLDQVRKNDRVMTIGGIIGTVVQVKDDEVVVKVDEATNTKVTFTRKAIQKVFTAEETSAKDKKQD